MADPTLVQASANDIVISGGVKGVRMGTTVATGDLLVVYVNVHNEGTTPPEVSTDGWHLVATLFPFLGTKSPGRLYAKLATGSDDDGGNFNGDVWGWTGFDGIAASQWHFDGGLDSAIPVDTDIVGASGVTSPVTISTTVVGPAESLALMVAHIKSFGAMTLEESGSSTEIERSEGAPADFPTLMVARVGSGSLQNDVAFSPGVISDYAAVGAAFGNTGPGDLDCDFSVDPTLALTGSLVTFIDESTGSPDGWLWDFGDGETSTDQNPTHAYAEAGTYTVSLTVTRSSDDEECETTQIDVITVEDALDWDVFAADDLLGPKIATLANASERTIRVEEDGAGMGSFKINRHSPEATPAILAKGNLVRVRIAEISAAYIGAFFLEQGDFEILSSGEAGAEELTFAGRGVFSYTGRARMWSEAYSTGVENVDTWSLIWKTGQIPNPVGAAVVDDDPTFVYVISATTRKVYKIRQSDRKVVRTSPALWSGSDNYAGGLSADPADATILWALEAPWSRGGAGNTKIRKVRISDWAILDTYNLGSAIKLTEVKASSTHLWTSRYEANNPIQKRDKSDGSVITGYDISYQGNAQENATGLSYNATEDLLAYWFADHDRALIADPSDPDDIIDRISTKGISPFGGDWTTEGADQFFYPVSYTADLVWKYQVTTGVPIDPVDGIWRLDEATPGAIAHRIILEAQHASRPQQPIPDLSHDFDFEDDSDGNPWDTHPGTEEFTANVGDYVDETLLRLIPYGLTLQMDPNTLELLAYNDQDFGTDRSSATFAAGKVRLVGATNIAESLRRRLDDRMVDSHELVAYDNGYALSVDDDLGYVREGFLATSLRKEATAEGTGDAELARQRRDSDAQAVVIPWGDDEAAGFYLPGPAGSNGHYWVGDTIRVHSGSGNFDLDEQDREVKAITITELDAGGMVDETSVATGLDRRWVAIADLASVFYPIFDPVDPPTKGSKRLGGTEGAGGGGTKTVRAEVRIRDTLNDEAHLGKTLESDDWAIWRSGDSKVGINIRRPRLDELRDVDIPEITDGQTIVYDEDSATFVPGDVSSGAGSGGFDVTPPQTVPLPPWVKPSGSGIITADPQGRISIDTGAGYKAFPGLTFLEGRLHLVYRDGTNHNSAGGVIKYRTSDDLGRTWTSAATIYTPGGTDDYRDPCITALSSGRLLLSLHRATTGGTIVVEVLTGYSDNRGQSWSSLTAVTSTFTDEVAASSPPLELPNGTILQAGYGNDSGVPRYTSVVWSSDDGGLTFGNQVTIATDGTLNFNETTIRLLASGKLVALIREETTGDTYRSASTDAGATWSAEAMVIDNSVGSRPDFVEFYPGALLWFGRGTSTASRWAVSWDEGATWTALQETDSGETKDAQYHSPVVLAPGYVAVVYCIENSSTDSDIYLRYYYDGYGTDPLGQARFAGLFLNGIEFDDADPDDGEVWTYDSGAGKYILEPATGTVTAADLTALGVVGPILIADDHSTPLVFADLLQTEEGDDLLYADLV